MDDAHNPNEFEIYAIEYNIQVENVETKSNGRRNQMTPPYIVETIGILRVELHSCREYNERLLRAQEEHNQLNATMLQILTDIQSKINHGKNSEKSRK